MRACVHALITVNKRQNSPSVVADPWLISCLLSTPGPEFGSESLPVNVSAETVLSVVLAFPNPHPTPPFPPLLPSLPFPLTDSLWWCVMVFQRCCLCLTPPTRTTIAGWGEALPTCWSLARRRRSSPKSVKVS